MEQVTLPEKIETRRLHLQRLRYEDAEEIFYTYASKEEATRFVTFATHKSIKDTFRFLNYAVPAWQQGTDFTFSLRLKESGRLAGTLGVVNESGKAQVGYILGPTYWNYGYATEACQAITDCLKSNSLFFRIGSFVDCENVLSAKVLEKCGYKQEARLANWLRFPNQQNKPKDCWLYTL